MKYFPYNAKLFFDSAYRLTEKLPPELTSIGPGLTRREARYHYNLVENFILQALGEREINTMLDVGSGFGFLISFYLEIIHPRLLCIEDLSSVAFEWLLTNYGKHPQVRVRQGDISAFAWRLPCKFDLITAIGVFFHIVNDDEFEIALENMAWHLKPNGLLLATDEYGWCSRDKQLHYRDSFESWEEFFKKDEAQTLVNKRTRSVSHWKSVAEKAGLELVKILRARPVLRTPENSLGVWRRKTFFKEKEPGEKPGRD